jgi:hypothetical protein
LLGDLYITNDWLEAGSISSGDVDHSVNGEFDVEAFSPRRGRTYIENEKSQQYNLFLFSQSYTEKGLG